MEGLQFTSTKTNWNTREINHHHLSSLPPSLPFDSISPHLHVPMELAAIFHSRGRPNSAGLYVWYTWGQTFPGKHIQLLLKKKQVTHESKYSLLVLVLNTHCYGRSLFFFESDGFQCSFAGILIQSKTMGVTKVISQAGLLKKPKSLPCTTQKRTCTRNLSISPVLE